MKIDGGCHCGAITYEAEIDPESVGICHCTDCQTMSGSAFRLGVVAKEGSFKLLSGQPKIYEKTTAESGNHRALAFCPDCGTHLYSAPHEGAPGVYRIRVATARQRDRLPPKSQSWVRSAQSWVTDLGSIKSFEKQRG
jgi:hypothetical protein